MAQQTQSIGDIAKASITAYNRKDWDAVRAAIAPNCVYDEVATRRRGQGADEITSLWKAWAQALPDSAATFENTLVSDNTVVCELTWRGTHSGPLSMPGGQLAPTGRKIEVRACQIIEVSGARVQTIRHYFDMATLLQQLGATS
jgi:steroid delta-isomerase-like uncharacterized protein